MGWSLVVGFVLILLSSSPGRKSAWNPAWQFLVEILAPFQNLSKSLVNTVEDFWLNYFQLVDVRQISVHQQEQINSLKMENCRYREKLSTHERLTNLLQFKQETQHSVLAAQVIGLDPSGWFKSIIINKGKKDGLVPDMPVVNADGVVGRIVTLSPNYAKVLLIIDQNSAVDTLIQRTRDRGIVRGLASDICEMAYVEKSIDIFEDDIAVTSGLGGVFPKGIPVGSVIHVETLSGKLFKDIEIRPAVNFSKLEEVLIILKENKPSIPLNEKN